MENRRALKRHFLAISGLAASAYTAMQEGVLYVLSMCFTTRLFQFRTQTTMDPNARRLSHCTEGSTVRRSLLELLTESKSRKHALVFTCMRTFRKWPFILQNLARQRILHACSHMATSAESGVDTTGSADRASSSASRGQGCCATMGFRHLSSVSSSQNYKHNRHEHCGLDKWVYPGPLGLVQI